MAKDIEGNEIEVGDTVAYILKPWKGNQRLKIDSVTSVAPKSIVINDEYRVLEGRFLRLEWDYR